MGIASWPHPHKRLKTQEWDVSSLEFSGPLMKSKNNLKIREWSSDFSLLTQPLNIYYPSISLVRGECSFIGPPYLYFSKLNKPLKFSAESHFWPNSFYFPFSKLTHLLFSCLNQNWLALCPISLDSCLFSCLKCHRSLLNTDILQIKHILSWSSEWQAIESSILEDFLAFLLPTGVGTLIEKQQTGEER